MARWTDFGQPGIETSQITLDGAALTVSIGVADRRIDERADQTVARADAAL